MIKLLPFQEMIEHPAFILGYGLCSNVNDLYLCKLLFSNTVTHEYCLIQFLKEIGLNSKYPIGHNGYLTEKQSNRYGYNSKQARNNRLYEWTLSSGRKYKGMQGALRHNLYVRYCNWLVTNWPEFFCKEW